MSKASSHEYWNAIHSIIIGICMLEYRAADDGGGQASIVDLEIVAIKINLIFLTMWLLCAMLQLPRVKDDSRGLELSQQPNDVKLHLPIFLSPEILKQSTHGH